MRPGLSLSTHTPENSRATAVSGWLFLVAALGFTLGLGHYFVTGGEGPVRLAVTMVPLAVALGYLNDARKGELYPLLGPWGGCAVGAIILGICSGAAIYLNLQFDEIRIYRSGFWNTGDFIAGGAMVLLVLEYTRRKYLSLFIVIVILTAYTLGGPLLPGALHHPGISPGRALSAMSLEMSTGIFERLPQLGLTLIASFILVLSALRAFGVIDAILRGSGRLANRRPMLLPQSAVVGSFGVAAVSGSGAANAATTGSATIPALTRSGFPRVRAAAVETATSLGGQLMPPLMGIGAFMMADFMGVGYFDVVARGFGPALIYFFGVSLAVYLLSLRHPPPEGGVQTPPLVLGDWARLGAYFGAVVGLVVLMGLLRKAPMNAALTVFTFLLIALGLLHLAETAIRQGWRSLLRSLGGPLRKLVDTFATTTAELTVLLATLGILTATFTITGVPTQLGFLLMELAGVHVVLMILVAFAFGYLVGMGLPVAPTYVIVAVVAAPFMIRAGLDPWAVHFFAFFIAVFGELSPPASVTAAVTSRIAGASFIRTIFAALALALPLLLMTAAVFTRPEIIAAPAPGMFGGWLGALIGVLGITICLQARWRKPGSTLRRSILGLASLGCLFLPDLLMAGGCALLVLLLALAMRRSLSEKNRTPPEN